MKKIYVPTSIFAVFFIVGFAMILKTTSKFSVERAPAAVRQVYDFSHLRGSALDSAIKERIVVGMELFKESDRIGISLGHFAFVNPAGDKTLGCNEYTKVRMKFEAEGTVVNGERPSMEVEGACQFSEDLSKVNALYVPMRQIMAERPADGEFQFRGASEVSIRFSNLSDEWPRKWSLTKIQFKGPKAEVSVDQTEIRRSLGQPLMISFAE